jgi:hypothetical protein
MNRECTVCELHLDHVEERDAAAEGVGLRARRAHGGAHPVQGHHGARHPWPEDGEGQEGRAGSATSAGVFAEAAIVVEAGRQRRERHGACGAKRGSGSPWDCQVLSYDQTRRSILVTFLEQTKLTQQCIFV